MTSLKRRIMPSLSSVSGSWRQRRWHQRALSIKHQLICTNSRIEGGNIGAAHLHACRSISARDENAKQQPSQLWRRWHGAHKCGGYAQASLPALKRQRRLRQCGWLYRNAAAARHHGQLALQHAAASSKIRRGHHSAGASASTSWHRWRRYHQRSWRITSLCTENGVAGVTTAAAQLPASSAVNGSVAWQPSSGVQNQRKHLSISSWPGGNKRHQQHGVASDGGGGVSATRSACARLA